MDLWYWCWAKRMRGTKRSSKCNSYPGWCSYGTPSNDNQETACERFVLGTVVQITPRCLALARTSIVHAAMFQEHAILVCQAETTTLCVTHLEFGPVVQGEIS